MPRPSSEVEATAFLNLLVLGTAKAGKTCTVISTAPGPVYVINSDSPTSLRPVLEFTDDFEFDLCLGDNLRDIEKCIHSAREGVKAGKYKTVVWDTITKYCRRAEQIFEAADAAANRSGEANGMKYIPKFQRHIHNVLDRLFTIPCHVIVNSHWINDEGRQIEGQAPKKGEGIVPMLPGKLRLSIPGEFEDVIFLENKRGKREFITSDSGVFGSGGRNLPNVEVFPGDISALWDAMQERINTTKDETKK